VDKARVLFVQSNILQRFRLMYNGLEVITMKVKPKEIGDEHVRSVYKALKQLLNQESIEKYACSVKQTASYLWNLYSEIKEVTSKFDLVNPDQTHDLTLYLENRKINVNLFKIKKGSRIQPKNPGAKSFLSKYFLGEELQKKFNKKFNKNYLNYLKDIVQLKVGFHYINEEKELKKLVSNYFPKFEKNINPYRNTFLYSIREEAFELLKEFYNKKNDAFFNAYNIFFMTEDLNVVTYYGKSENDINVEEFNPGTPDFSDIQLYKTGKSSIGIKFGEVALTLRFKFESGPISSIKLAASYDIFPDERIKKSKNEKTIEKMKELLSVQHYIETSNSSNAIGKCHEALTYYYFIKEYPNISQVEPDECVELLNNYYSYLKPDVLDKLYKSTATVVPVIREKLQEKYKYYSIDSIELVPESYINDRLDTGDLQLILRVNGGYTVENISLKALSRRGAKLTTKNPGIGTILGPTYFNIGSMDSVVNEIKERFHIGEISHKESLEILAEELGLQLKGASQKQLKQGIENLLGNAMMAITFYEQNDSICKEHSNIESIIKVYLKTPSNIQNTLAWNNEYDYINLRVKFSKGHHHGWSSIKLTSEYQLK
jgi:hypothetical protein